MLASCGTSELTGKMANIDLNAKYTAQDVDDNNSKKNMIYTSDNGAQYVVTVTENLGESFGFDDVGTGDTGLPGLPQGFRMRVVRAVSPNGKVKQSFKVGKVGEAIYNEGGLITVARPGKSAGLVLAVVGVTGERKRLVTATDTGQASGDNN